ncbi:MAG: hypothetical protein WBH97_01710 [Rectinemataceae bacterium]
MSIEIDDESRTINDIDLVEGIFFNSMISLIQQKSVKTSWIQKGRLPEHITWSVMKIRPTHVRDLAMIMFLMEQDTKQNFVLSSDTKPGTPVKQSELYISENTWSFVKTLGAASSRLVGNRLQVSQGALSAEGIPFLDKDRCTFQDWLLINSILDDPDTDSRSISFVPELTQSITDCYRQNLDL